ncbi:MAG: hypothetical protein ABF293_03835, partial [Flavobacteriaceae bacterium]
MNNAIKYALLLVFLLGGLSVHCSEIKAIDLADRWDSESRDSGMELSLPDNKTKTAEAEFRHLARKHKIPTRKITNLVDVNSGYYIIAGAFGQQGNARKFIRTLSAKSLNPFVLFNPDNGLNYVSLEYHKSGLKAINSCLDRVKSEYGKDVWILQVENVERPTIQPAKKATKPIATDNNYEDFKKSTRKYQIAHRKMSRMEGAQNGFYLVAGVFGEKQNALKKKAAFSRKGLPAEILHHPENGMNYVSVRYTPDWKEAISDVRSKLSGKFSEKLWILEIKDKPVKLKERVTGLPSGAEEAKIFDALVDDKGIPTRSDPGFTGLDKGYYMVAGVFGDTKNARTYLTKLKKRLPEANLVIHPKSQLNYIYLDHYDKGTDAVRDYQSRMNGRFKDPLWILNIQKPDAKPLETKKGERANRDKAEPSTRPLRKQSILSRKFSGSPISNDKLLEKADLYFNKMWYAEAAELYEMVLNENPENQTFDIIRKAGDSHYFNTNMERAFYWYDILYSKYKSDMRAENLFKYAHSLKGTGKYSRAKRLMRLYNKALKNEGGSKPYRARPGDAAL